MQLGVQVLMVLAVLALAAVSAIGVKPTQEEMSTTGE